MTRDVTQSVTRHVSKLERCAAPWLAPLVWLIACVPRAQVETREQSCEAAYTTRSCLCDDSRIGVAQCLGPGDAGPCDCEGEPPWPIVDVQTSGDHTCVRWDDARGAACWGRNDDGQLGDGTRKDQRTPTWLTLPRAVREDAALHALALAGGDPYGFTCTLDDEGHVRCFGRNEAGELGDGSRTPRATPSEPAVKNVVALRADTLHTCALRDDASVHCWGLHDSGQVGAATQATTFVLAPTKVTLPKATTLDVGWKHSCAITTDGAVWCWGENEKGQLGLPGGKDRFMPVLAVDVDDARLISAGLEHTCIVVGDERIECFGDDSRGQLGDGDERSDGRVVVRGLPEGSRITQLASGFRHNLALTRDGAVYAWGHNHQGQLGDGTTTTRTEAIRIGELDGAIAIAAGGNVSCALVSAHDVRCTGDNRFGQLGTGTVRDERSWKRVRFLDLPPEPPHTLAP